MLPNYVKCFDKKLFKALFGRMLSHEHISTIVHDKKYYIILSEFVF